MLLSCSQRCGGTLFRALSAEVDVNRSGEYQGHRLTQSSFICLNCGAPALDLGEVSQTMAAEAEDDVAELPVDVLCPQCETAISVLPGELCPNCGLELELVS
jgi:rubredoxin